MKNLIYGLVTLIVFSACSPKNQDKSSFETKLESLASFTDTSTALADYGTVTASTTRIFTFKNEGTSAGPGAPTLTDPAFSIILQSGCANVNIGSTCTVRVNFNPSGKSVGVFTTTLDVGGTTKELTATVAAATIGGSTTGGTTTGGTTTGGGSSNIEASVSSVVVVSPLDYGSFTGTQTATKIITLKNTATTSTGPHTATLSDSDFSFTLNSCSNKTLAPNGTCSVRVTFNASGKTAALYEASLVFGSLTLPVQATVAGATTGGSTTGGSTTGGTTSGSSAIISFLDGTTPITTPFSIGSTTTTSITKIITIKNTGTLSTGPHTATLSDADLTFTLNSCSNKTLAPNGSCTVRVTFSSTGKAAGEHSSTLTFGSGTIDLTATKTGAVCTAGEHLENEICVSDIQSCSITNGVGQKTWNGSAYGTCQLVSCNVNFEQVNTQCLASCVSGKHRDPVSLFCVNNSRNCNPMPTNANAGTQTWNGTNQVWEACNVTGCVATFHTEDNLSCTSNVRACQSALPPNATAGQENWTTSWGSCVATACESTHLLLGTGPTVGCYFPLAVNPDNTAGEISVNPGEIINFAATGGLAPYSFSFDTINPAGLGSSIGSSNGVYLAGVSVGGVTNEYVVVSDSLGQSMTITLAVQPATIEISPLTVTLDGTQTQQFSTTGGFAPITFRIDPASTISSSISASGLYTAGTNNTALAITETIIAEDNQGNEVSAQVTVNPSGTITDVYSLSLSNPSQPSSGISGVIFPNGRCSGALTVVRFKNGYPEAPPSSITVSVQSSNQSIIKFYSDSACTTEISQPVERTIESNQMIAYSNYFYAKILVTGVNSTTGLTPAYPITLSSSDPQYTSNQSVSAQLMDGYSYPLYAYSSYSYQTEDPIHANTLSSYVQIYPEVVTAGEMLRPIRSVTDLTSSGVDLSFTEGTSLISSLSKKEVYLNGYYRTDLLQIVAGNPSSNNTLQFSMTDYLGNTVSGMNVTILPGGNYPTVQDFAFGYNYSCAIISNNLYCWGSLQGRGFRKADGSGNMHQTQIQYKPVEVDLGTIANSVKKVATAYDGELRTCVITLNDEAYCNNPSGNFIKISGAGEVVTKIFVTGLGGQCRLRNDNTIICSGGIAQTPASMPSGTIHEIAYSSGNFGGNYAHYILIDDKVYSWTGTNTPTIVSQWSSGVTAIAVNDGIACVVKNGSVNCNFTNSGQFHNITNSNFTSGVSKITTSGLVENSVCALKTDSSFHCLQLYWNGTSLEERSVMEVASAGSVSTVYHQGNSNCFKYTNGVIACAPYSAAYNGLAAHGNTGWLANQGWGPKFVPIPQNILYENACGFGAYKDGSSCVCKASSLTYNSELGVCHSPCSNDPNATLNIYDLSCSCSAQGNAFTSTFDYFTNTCTQDCGTNGGGVFDTQSNSCTCIDSTYIFDPDSNGYGCRPNCEAGGGTWNTNMFQCECLTSGAWDGTTCSTSCPNPDDFWVQGVNAPPPVGCQSTCSNLSSNGECGEASARCDQVWSTTSYCVPRCSTFTTQSGCETNNCSWDGSTSSCYVNCSTYNGNNDVCADFSSEVGQSCEPLFHNSTQECIRQCSTISDEMECSAQTHCVFSGSCFNSHELGCTNSGGTWNTPPGDCSCPIDTTWNPVTKACEGAGGNCSMYSDFMGCMGNGCTWSPYTYPCSTYDNNEQACNNPGTCTWTPQGVDCSIHNNDLNSCNSHPECTFSEPDPENSPGIGDCSGQYQDSLNGTCSGDYEVGGQCQ